MTTETVQPSGSAPFRFLDLPLELRRFVYNHALTSPDEIHHVPDYGRICQQSGRLNLAIGLLSTCSQIHGEASSTLYEANTFLTEIKLSMDTHPVMAEESIPSHVRPRIKHMFLVFDVLCGTCSNYCDFRLLQGFTGLQTVRIALISFNNWAPRIKSWGEVLGNAIQRVPAGCEVGFGSRSDLERDFIRNIIRSTYWGMKPPVLGGVVELGEDVLGGIAEGLSCVQGSKSGTD